MAAPNKKQNKEQTEEQKKKYEPKEEYLESLTRIASYDIPGSKNLYSGLTRIKGVSWALSNALCIKLKLPKNKKISELSKDEIIKIESFLKNPEIKDYMKNRQKDQRTGESKHLVGTTLDITKDFDIRRLKKIRSYRGARHAAGQPSRGQRTRSHFRSKARQAVGVKRKAK
nr:hypothetical protein [uncultured archaeon]AQS34135.1 hypothetical protein [uncultured archaeon]